MSDLGLLNEIIALLKCESDNKIADDKSNFTRVHIVAEVKELF
jgi:hypothetical protein